MTGAALVIECASLTLGQFSLRAIDLELKVGEIMVLLGPNGAGKSVCLEMIAGFHRASSGRILIHGREVTDLPPEQRRVGLVFQNFGLFPHCTVAANVSLGIRARRRAGNVEAKHSVGELLTQFGVAHLSDRYPQDLSPGEKQRVALARALATQPDLFLFDEPFSALDARTRVSLREELKAFLRHSGMAAIFVSHDQTDAALLADRVAVMNHGEILQVGAMSDIFGKPVNAFVAEFTGVENILAGRLSGQRGDLRRIEVADAVLYAPSGDFASGEALLCMRAEEVGLSARDGAAGPFGLVGATNRLSGRVVEAVCLGATTKVTVDCGFALVARLTSRQLGDLALAPGREVIAEIEAGSIHLLKPDAAGSAAALKAPQAYEAISIPYPWRSAAKSRA
jgi:molybdate/tungstate transport system ATP-binding protein